MSEELRVLTDTLIAWEALRDSLWAKINKELPKIGSKVRLRVGSRLPKPPPGATLAEAVSAFRVSVRAFSLYIDLDDANPWLCIGHLALTSTSQLSFRNRNRLEELVEQTINVSAKCAHSDKFIQDVMATPTIRHAAATKAQLQEFISQATPKKQQNTKDIEKLRKAIRKCGRDKKPDVIIKEASIGAKKGRDLLRILEALGEYDGFARRRANRYNPI